MNARRAFPALVLLISAIGLATHATGRAPTDARGAATVAPAWLVDLNSAPQPELEHLPRIGPTLAERIILERDANGPFTSLDDLATRVRGIGPRTLDRIAPYARDLR